MTYTVVEVATLLGLSRASCYEAVRRGEIPCIRIGKRCLVPKVGLERMLAEVGNPNEGQGLHDG